jgi:hypothetical protein
MFFNTLLVKGGTEVLQLWQEHPQVQAHGTRGKLFLQVHKTQFGKIRIKTSYNDRTMYRQFTAAKRERETVPFILRSIQKTREAIA